MRTITIVVKAKWFWPLLNGDKDAEYRVDKAHWHKRLMSLREGDRVRFCLGYRKNRPTCTRIVSGVSVVPERELPPEVWRELFATKGGSSPFNAMVIVVRLKPLVREEAA